MKKKKQTPSPDAGKVWIDLENSPHVPFFAPIIDELEKRGYSVLVTGRDCFQVADLTKLFNIDCKLVGHHSGKNKIAKLLGLCQRSLQLDLAVLGKKPRLALSHGSRSHLLASAILGIPHLMLFDYEHAKPMPLVQPDWAMVPEVISTEAVPFNADRVLKYPGIKEDVYVPRFKPDPSLRARLEIKAEDLLVTIRPPANEAHYHNPQSDELYHAVIDFLGAKPNTKVVLLPRNDKQAVAARNRWPGLFAAGKVQIPNEVLDGLNLIWHSDLVISGGGTMNREAAALGVPVYSIFRGKTGAVDRYLSENGRMVLLESVEDVRTKIVLARRSLPKSKTASSETLEFIVNTVVSLMESPHRRPSPRIQ